MVAKNETSYFMVLFGGHETGAVSAPAHDPRNGLVISYDEVSDTINAHLLQAIKTRAKDDTGKTLDLQ